MHIVDQIFSTFYIFSIMYIKMLFKQNVWEYVSGRTDPQNFDPAIFMFKMRYVLEG